jgi:two-component system response regulator AtoC
MWTSTMPVQRAGDKTVDETRNRKRILVADDDQAIQFLLCELLQSAGYEVSTVRTGEELLAKVTEQRPDLLLLDVRLPDMSGLDVLERLREGDTGVPAIVMTAYGSSNIAIRAIQLGAYDYITKPFDQIEDLLFTIRRFFHHQELTAENAELRQQLIHDPSAHIVGQSPAMLEVYKTIGRTANSDATVLIMGETGTGKELVARAIHQASPRRNYRFEIVPCSSLPETLIESELFGHEKGAFTSAVAQRKGRFELAHKGTIFLDEIGEMSLSTQRKLLRVLQEREFERVGGNVTIKVDVRVIAATNKNLAEEARAGRFREDLFYRLNVVPIFMPPLRDRKEDIPLLVEHFLDKHRYVPGAPPARISEEALNALMQYDWPGNVRELENTILRAVVLAQGGLITPEHLTYVRSGSRPLLDIHERLHSGARLQDLLEEVRRLAVREALEQHHGDVERAARALGIPMEELKEMLKHYGLQPVA